MSDQATVCPYCDYPFTDSAGARRRVQLMERTAKRWKGLRALGWVFVLVGALVVGAEWVAGHAAGVTVGWCMALAGVGCIGLSRAGAWWYHG